MTKNIKKLNQSILDDLTSKPREITQDYMGTFTKKSNVKIPKTIEEVLSDEVIEDVEKSNKKIVSKTEKAKNIQKRKKNPEIFKDLEELPIEKYQQANDIIKEEIQEVNNISIPENLDVIETEKEINEALDDIPGKVEISDLEIAATKEKTGKGYFKSKVNFKNSEIPEQISKIATLVKKESNGVIVPRTTDLRIIANTNKTQLRNSKLKLSAISVTFRPSHGKGEDARKGTRIILSISENYDMTRDIILYYQEGRNKEITIMNPSNGFNGVEDQMNQWLAKIITDFFKNGYDIVRQKIVLRSISNPLMQVADIVLETGKYKVRPHVDNSQVFALDVKSKGSENQWLYVSILSTDYKNTYKVYAQKFNDDDFEVEMSVTKPAKKFYTIDDLKNNIVKLLDLMYDHDWTETLGIGGVSLESRMKRLKHYVSLLDFRQMKLAYDSLIKYIELENENGSEVDLRIERVISKKDFAEKANLIGEAVVGRTMYCEFVLSYLLQPLKGADKRSSSSFITSEEYYTSTGVKNRNEPSKRSRSILAKQGKDRNYNTGDYLFLLEYTVDGKSHKYWSKKFSDVLDKTKFLSNKPEFPKSEYYKYIID